ncbi:hypothetical protein Tco_0304230 [Tanacetum coccineum]
MEMMLLVSRLNALYGAFIRAQRLFIPDGQQGGQYRRRGSINELAVPFKATPLRVVIPFKSSFGLVTVLLGRVPEVEAVLEVTNLESIIISLYVGLKIFLRNHLEIEELELDRRELDKQEVEQPEVDRFDLDEPGVGDLGTKYVDHPFGAKDEVIFKWNFFKIKRSTTEVGPGDV